MKINLEKKVKGIDLEPLNVDQLAGTVGPLLEVRYYSQIMLKTSDPNLLSPLQSRPNFDCAKPRF